MVPPPAALDPFISSLFYTLPLDESSKDAQAESLNEGNLTTNNSDEKMVERYAISMIELLFHDIDVCAIGGKLSAIFL